MEVVHTIFVSPAGSMEQIKNKRKFHKKKTENNKNLRVDKFGSHFD